MSNDVTSNSATSTRMHDTRASREQIDRLADDIAVLAARIDAATHELLGAIRLFDQARGWSVQGAKSCAHWLSWRIGVGLVAARERVRVAHALAELPHIDGALARGELSYAKVRAMTRVASADNETLLLDMARGATGAQLERICAGFRRCTRGHAGDEEHRFVRRRHTGDGSVSIELRLLPDEAERVWQALRDTRIALSGGDSAESSPAATPRLADAAVAMAERQIEALRRAPTSKGAVAAERRQLMVHLSERRLGDRSAWRAELGDGSAIGGETLRRLACDSGLLVAKTDETGRVLDIGRRRRTVSAPLLRALLMRDRRCRFPGCTHAVFVEAHHIAHWANGGATSLHNTLLVCHAHHVGLHEGGFTVERTATGDHAFFDAVGRRIEPVPALSALEPDVALGLAEHQCGRDVDIDRRTSLPSWDGRPMDRHAAVGALVWRHDRARRRATTQQAAHHEHG